MKCYIYQFLNTFNGKIYIGKTINVKERYNAHIRVSEGGKEKYHQHFQIIHAAIAKYKNLIEFNVIQEVSNEIEGNVCEIYWIKFFDSANPKLGYNLTLGGEGMSGRKLSEKQKNALLAYNIGRIVSKETRQKTSQSVKALNLIGDKNSKAIITNGDALKIRELYATGNYTQNQLGIMFNIDQTTVSNIVKYKSYKV